MLTQHLFEVVEVLDVGVLRPVEFELNVEHLGVSHVNELDETRMPKCREPTHIPSLGTCLAKIMKMKNPKHP